MQESGRVFSVDVLLKMTNSESDSELVKTDLFSGISASFLNVDTKQFLKRFTQNPSPTSSTFVFNISASFLNAGIKLSLIITISSSIALSSYM